MKQSTHEVFKTIKSAEAAGFHRMKSDEYGGEQITVKGVLLAKNPSNARSMTAWKEAGRRVIDPQQPHAVLCHRVGGAKSVTYSIYRIDQTAPIKRRSTPKPPFAFSLQLEIVLAALFTVNRSAKRYRDAAQSCYQCSQHGFAKMHREKKEHLYSLKEKGLIYAYRMGFVAAACLHGTLTVYRGSGYCFHSPLRPKSVTLESHSSNEVFVEAKPRKASEMRLCDAIATLEQIAVDRMGFDYHDFQRQPRNHDHYDNDEFDSDDDEYDWEDGDWDDDN